MRVEVKQWVVFTYPGDRRDEKFEIGKGTMHRDVKWPEGAASFHILRQATVFDGSEHGKVRPIEKLETWIHPKIRSQIRALQRSTINGTYGKMHRLVNP